MSGNTAPFLPTSAQALLLKACLLKRDEALAAWQTWRMGINLDTLDLGSIRLLPFLLTRLEEYGIQDSQFGKYRGVQRRTWAHNHILFRQAGTIFGLLTHADIPALALKGAALASRYYPLMTMRPMGDLDLMIRPEHALRAFDVLEAAGWRTSEHRPRDRADLAVVNATNYAHSAACDFASDIHWRLLPTTISMEGDAELWRHARKFEIGNTTGLLPCAADLLLHTCAHGARFNGVPPIRWIADSAMLVRSGEVDWEYLLRQAIRYRLTLPLGATLGYLADAMEVEVPTAVVESLNHTAVRSIDRALFRLDQRPFDKRSFFGLLRRHLHLARLALGSGPASYWSYFRRLRAGRSPIETLRWIAERATLGRRA